MLEVTFGQINISRNSNLNQEKGSFFGIFKYLFGCQIIWKMRVLYFFLKICFFHDTPYFFFFSTSMNRHWYQHWIFVAKKDDNPLWVRCRLNIFMNYSLKILFATNCKACDLANCLWLLIKDSFRASKIKLDANVTYNHCQLWQVKVPKNYRVVKKRQTFYYLIIFKLRLKSPRLGISTCTVVSLRRGRSTTAT